MTSLKMAGHLWIPRAIDSNRRGETLHYHAGFGIVLYCHAGQSILRRRQPIQYNTIPIFFPANQYNTIQYQIFSQPTNTIQYNTKLLSSQTIQYNTIHTITLHYYYNYILSNKIWSYILCIDNRFYFLMAPSMMLIASAQVTSLQTSALQVTTRA